MARVTMLAAALIAAALVSSGAANAQTRHQGVVIADPDNYIKSDHRALPLLRRDQARMNASADAYSRERSALVGQRQVDEIRAWARGIAEQSATEEEELALWRARR